MTDPREIAARWARMDAATRERELAELRRQDSALAHAVEAYAPGLLGALANGLLGVLAGGLVLAVVTVAARLRRAVT